MIGWSSGYGVSYNFLTLPGGGALAGTFTNIFGVQTTSVPLIDASGSTIALVNAASTQSPPATTYTYDPAGNPTVSGTANDWPFQYQGMEKEFTDPGPYYYTGGGQFYSAQIMRSPSETGQTSSQGAGGGSAGSGGGGGGGGPAGNPLAAPSGGGSSPNFSQSPQESGEAFGVGAGAEAATAGFIAAYNAFLVGAEGVSLGYATPVVVVGLIAEGLFELLDDLFGGSSSEPPTPRQLRHKRHPLYPVILGFPNGLIPDEASNGKPELCGDAEFCGTTPLQAPEYRKAPPRAQTPTGLGPFFACGGVFTAFNPELTVGCILTGVGCGGGDIPACGAMGVLCGSYFGGIGLCYGAAFPNSRLGPAARGPLPNQ
jgi:hypothetical protein